MINVVDPLMLSAEDRLAIQQQRKTIYQVSFCPSCRNSKLTAQGLWWGGERLWLEDMVRINKLRSQLPLDQFPIDGHELHDGCVFLKIRYIHSSPKLLRADDQDNRLDGERNRQHDSNGNIMEMWGLWRSVRTRSREYRAGGTATHVTGRHEG